MVIKALYKSERGFWDRRGGCQNLSTLGCLVLGPEEENEQGAKTKTKRDKKRCDRRAKKQGTKKEISSDAEDTSLHKREDCIDVEDAGLEEDVVADC